MNIQVKIAFAIVLIILMVVVGCYASGAIFFAWKNINFNKLEFLSFFNYYLKFEATPSYQLALRVSGAVGFLTLPILSLVVFLRLKLDQRDKSLYGEAKFADVKDLEKAGFFETKSTSVLVGKIKDKYLLFSGQQFPILSAPTRSGKGVGIVIPNLLAYQDSMVVLDIKQENYELTSGFRQKYGQEIYVFNPFAEDRKTHRWNPLSYVSEDPTQRVSDLMSIASMLYAPGDDPKNAFWLNQAQNAFLAFALFLFDRYKNDKAKGEEGITPTIGELYRLSAGNGESFKDYLKELANAEFISNQGKQAFSGLLTQAEETFSNILATFKAPLNPWLNPITDAATSDNDFLLTDVRKRRMTIYVAIQPNKLAEAQLILNLFFSQLINLNTKELPQNNPELKYQCLLLLDEFTSMGKVDVIAKAVSYIAGYNIRLFPIIQSLSQLDSVYGKDVSRTLMTNHALQIMYTPREQQDANDYSEMLGYTTVKKKSLSKGKGRQGSTSESENEEKRALMLPQELKAMSSDKEIFMFEGIDKPVSCDKIRYYLDPVFKERLLPKAEIPILDVEKFI